MEFTIKKIEAPKGVKLYLNSDIEPHGHIIWQDGKKVFPAAFNIGKQNKEPAHLRVTISIGAPFDEGIYILTGKNESKHVLFQGTAKILKVDKYVIIDVYAKKEPKDFSFATTLCWQLNRFGSTESIGHQREFKTSLELYWLYQVDTKLFHLGVPVEILRLVRRYCRLYRYVKSNYKAFHYKRRVRRLTQKNTLIKAILLGCFYIDPLPYNITYPTSNFVIMKKKGSLSKNNIKFRLGNYLYALKHPEESIQCDCIDIAVAIQLYLKAIGILDVYYCDFEPFGYVKLTHLVGRGLSNNPTYGKNRTQPVIGPKRIKRKYFNLHSFCCIPVTEIRNCPHSLSKNLTREVRTHPENWRILDATIGPHVGNETPKDYQEHTIDTIFPKGGEEHTGNYKENISVFQGLKHIVYEKEAIKENGVLS